MEFSLKSYIEESFSPSYSLTSTASNTRSSWRHPERIVNRITNIIAIARFLFHFLPPMFWQFSVEG